MELIFFNILQKYSSEKEFVYFKTLGACVEYIRLSCHFDSALCNNNKYKEFTGPLFLSRLCDALCSTYKDKSIVNLDGYLYEYDGYHKSGDSNCKSCLIDICMFTFRALHGSAAVAASRG